MRSSLDVKGNLRALHCSSFLSLPCRPTGGTPPLSSPLFGARTFYPSLWPPLAPASIRTVDGHSALCTLGSCFEYSGLLSLRRTLLLQAANRSLPRLGALRTTISLTLPRRLAVALAAAVRNLFDSLTTGASAPPVSSPPPRSLSSSHSVHPRPASVPIAASPYPAQIAPIYSARNAPASFAIVDSQPC